MQMCTHEKDQQTHTHTHTDTDTCTHTHVDTQSCMPKDVHPSSACGQVQKRAVPGSDSQEERKGVVLASLSGVLDSQIEGEGVSSPLLAFGL